MPTEATAWLQQHAVPFQGADPTLDNTDLEVLRAVVGDARIVSLGEATHGTREFFQMKHRVLKYLVEEGDMVIMGFAFDRGRFTAVTQSPSGSFTGLETHEVPEAPPANYEHFFRSTGFSQFILDMRDVTFGGPATSWFAGPRIARSLGCCFQPSSPRRYLNEQRFPDEYDVMIYFEATSASVVRPFNYPTDW